MQKDSGRSSSIDAVKLLAIFLVVIYHYNSTSYNILAHNAGFDVFVNYFIHGFSSISIPLFFLVNGWLLLFSPLNLKKHLAKTGRIYLLIIVWSVLTLVLFIFIRGDYYTVSAFAHTVFDLKLGTNNYLWFLYELVSIYLIYPLIKFSFDQQDERFIWSIFIIALFFSFICVSIDWSFTCIKFINGKRSVGDLTHLNIFRRMSPFGNHFYALVYFIGGGLLRRHIHIITQRFSFGHLIFVCVAGLSILFLYGIIASLVSGELVDTAWSGLDSIPTLFVTVSVFVMFLRLPSNYWLINNITKSIGGNTLGIYFLHIPIGYTIHLAFQILNESGNLFLDIFLASKILIISWVLTLIGKRIPYIRSLFSI